MAVSVDAWSALQVLCITVNDMYVNIVGSWANHCEHKNIIHSINSWKISSSIWLLVDGSCWIVARPRCSLSFRLFRAANLWWHEINNRRSIQYNGMLLQWICPAIRAHNLMKGMLEWLVWSMKEGGKAPDYVCTRHPSELQPQHDPEFQQWVGRCRLFWLLCFVQLIGSQSGALAKNSFIAGRQLLRE